MPQTHTILIGTLLSAWIAVFVGCDRGDPVEAPGSSGDRCGHDLDCEGMLVCNGGTCAARFGDPEVGDDERPSEPELPESTGAEQPETSSGGGDDSDSDECSSDSQCGYREACIASRCQTVDCTNDAHCSGCNRCVSNYCSPCGEGPYGCYC